MCVCVPETHFACILFCFKIFLFNLCCLVKCRSCLPYSEWLLSFETLFSTYHCFFFLLGFMLIHIILERQPLRAKYLFFQFEGTLVVLYRRQQNSVTFKNKFIWIPYTLFLWNFAAVGDKSTN